MKAYDERVRRVMGKEMEISYRIQRMLSRPWLIDFATKQVLRNPNLLYTIAQMYTDLEVRKKALNPFFWMKMLVKR